MAHQMSAAEGQGMRKRFFDRSWEFKVLKKNWLPILKRWRVQATKEKYCHFGVQVQQSSTKTIL
jgi:hypothetical protein